MKGHQKLYADLIPTSLPPSTGEQGKRNTFIEKRDRAICARFYYHSQIFRKRYDDALVALMDEFYLGAETLTNRMALDEPYAFLNELFKEDEKKALKRLSEEFAHYDWSGIRR